jgi:hypothetical protein
MFDNPGLFVTAVLDYSSNALFLGEIFRGMAYTLKAFFEPKVTVSSSEGCRAQEQ